MENRKRNNHRMLMQFLPGFKQVLSKQEGWIGLEDYYEILKNHSHEILVVSKGRCIYTCPNSFSQTYYKGILIEIKSNLNRIIVKPNTVLKVNNIEKRAFELNIGDELPNYCSTRSIDKCESILWKGNIFSLRFSDKVLLPIKFEDDYILIPT